MSAGSVAPPNPDAKVLSPLLRPRETGNDLREAHCLSEMGRSESQVRAADLSMDDLHGLWDAAQDCLHKRYPHDGWQSQCLVADPAQDNQVSAEVCKCRIYIGGDGVEPALGVTSARLIER